MNATDLFARLEDVIPRLAPPALVAAWVFGSRVEGRERTGSDLDLGLLLDRVRAPTPGDRFRARLRFGARLSESLGRDDLDLVVVNDAPPPFARRIVTAGRPVYVADAGAEHAFRRDVQLRAADLEPFLRRNQARKLQVLGGP